MFTFVESQVSVQPEKSSIHTQRTCKNAAMPSQEAIPSAGAAGKLKSLQVKPALEAAENGLYVLETKFAKLLSVIAALCSLLMQHL